VSAPRIPAGITPEDWAKLPPALQDALRKAAAKPALTAPYTPAPLSIEPSPVRATPAPTAAPEEFSTASPVNTSAIQTADPFTQLRAQIDVENAAAKQVQQAIPSEAGQSISPREMANRQGVAARAAKRLADSGITSGQIDALRQTNPELYDQFWNQLGKAPGISKQARYTPSAESGTRDLILERLSVLEGQGKVLKTDPTRALSDFLGSQPEAQSTPYISQDMYDKLKKAGAGQIAEQLRNVRSQSSGPSPR
jgi:hypothetical protein